MDLKLFSTVFATVFLAELGDKTQIATLTFASDERHSRMAVFLGAASALVASAALGVLGGTLMRGWMNPRVLETIAGVLFLVLGAWTLFGAWRGSGG